MGDRTLVLPAALPAGSHTTTARWATSWSRRLLLGVLAAMVTILTFGAVADAQESNSLNEILPDDGAEVGEPPSEIELGFDQAIGDEQNITLNMTCADSPITFGEAQVDDENVVFPIVSDPLPTGTCIIDWRLTTVDGDEIATGNSAFSLTGGSEPAADTAEAAPTTTVPVAAVDGDDAATGSGTDDEGSFGAAIWLFRFLSALCIMVVFGALAVIGVGWPEGPEYGVTTGFLRSVWIAGVVTTLLYVVFYAAEFSDGSLASGFNVLSWFDLFDDGWTGFGAIVRLVAVAASGYVALVPERIIDPTTAMWGWLIPGIAVMSLALTRISGPIAPIGLVIGIVHVLASAVWIGGAALVGKVVLAGPGEEDLAVATRTFSRVSVAAIAISVITGLLEMFRIVGGDLFTTGHGQVLLLKVVGVAAMLAIGMAARQQVGARLSGAYEMTVHNADRFRRSFTVEAVIGVVVLGLSGWMLSFDIVDEVPWADEDYTYSQPFIDSNTGLEATVFVGPARVGPNGYLVQVDQPTDGITDLTVRFIPPEGTQNGEAFIIEQSVPLSGAGSAWLPAEIGAPFGVPGTWTVEIEATTAAATNSIRGPLQINLADGSEPTGGPVTQPPAATSGAQVQVVEESTPEGSIATERTTPSTSVTATTG